MLRLTDKQVRKAIAMGSSKGMAANSVPSAIPVDDVVELGAGEAGDEVRLTRDRTSARRSASRAGDGSDDDSDADEDISEYGNPAEVFQHRSRSR
jgi:hypothetical protein